MGKSVGRRPNWKKAIVKLARRRHDRDLRGLSATCRFVNSSRSPRARASARSPISPRSRARTPEKSLIEPLKKSGRPRQPRPHLDAPHRRWPQAEVPHHRLQAQQASASPATVKEIEYDPNRSARIALVEYADGEKRYILHPKGLDGRRHDRVGPGLRRPHRQRAAARRDPARHRGAQHRAQDRQGRADVRARPGCRREVVAKEGEYVTLRMAVDRNAPASTAAAWRRSARSATPSTSCSRGARRARRAGWAGARRCAAKS